MLGHGTDTTTARGWQGELWDSEDDTCELLHVVEVVEEVEEVERLMRKIVKQERDDAM